MVKHHDVVGRYVTIEVDDCEYKVFYLQNGKASCDDRMDPDATNSRKGC